MSDVLATLCDYSPILPDFLMCVDRWVCSISLTFCSRSFIFILFVHFYRVAGKVSNPFILLNIIDTSPLAAGKSVGGEENSLKSLKDMRKVTPL